MKTLADIARQVGVSPQAVGKWRDSAVAKYGQLPFHQNGNRKEYAPEAVEKILEFAPFCPEPTIESGNHRESGQLAAVPLAADLGAFRGDIQLTTFENPLEVATQAIGFVDSLLSAIELDTEFQVSQVQQTQRVNAQLRSKLEEVRQRKTQYATESRLISLLQNKEASELEQNMAEIKSLGKPNE